ncbi:MAG: hypothetical protein JWO56_477 [Acidobacteria bacterium]|nr:hypothetical protein [Acidobacteriota bacterium]
MRVRYRGMTDDRPAKRFDLLSRSDSGLSYVRERRGGLTRVLTDAELADFDDPKPCPECAEQFGCEHFNCAGEPLFDDAAVETHVPAEWRSFARDYGLSREDLERLATISQTAEGEYQAATAAPHDLRTLELVLLLNEAR